MRRALRNGTIGAGVAGLGRQRHGGQGPRDAQLRRRGFGNNVQVQISDLWVRYAHLEEVQVSDGDQVAPGTVLGLEGSTGFSTGPHLHFEVDRGCPALDCSIDPANLISLPAAS